MSGDASDLDNADDEFVEQGIVDEMDEVRSKLGGGIDRLSEDMRQVFDWQAYVRSAPLTSVGIAAAVGYLFAPALRSRSAPQPVQTAPANSSGGILGTLSSLAFGSILRIATGYVTEILTSNSTSPPEKEPPRARGTSEATGSPADQTLDLGL